MEKTKIINFLSNFGTPLITGICPVKGSSVKSNLIETIDTAIGKNKELPLNIYFTPNGNFGVNNTDTGKKCSFTKNKAAGDFYNALCVDIDGDYGNESKANMLEKIEEVNNTLFMRPTYIIETGKGFHLYRLIDKKNKAEIAKEFGDKIFEISKHLRELYEGDKNCVATKNISALMRIPGMMYWKKDGTMLPEVKIIEHNSASLLTTRIISDSLDQLKDVTTIKRDEKKYEAEFGIAEYKKVNQLPFEEILKRLPKRKYEGVSYHVILKGNSLHIMNTETGIVKETDGYKYRREKNIVTVFSKAYHSISERPRGTITNFVLGWFYKDIEKAISFFSVNFGMDLHTTLLKLNGEIEKKIMLEGLEIWFTKKGITKVEANTEKILFRNTFNIIGRGTTKKTSGFMESESDNDVYLCELNGEEFLLYYVPQKTSFNKIYGSNIFFYGGDNDLGLFYESLKRAEWIPEIELITNNGIYGNKVVLGGHIYKTIGDNIIKSYCVIDEQFNTVVENQITTKEFLGKLSDIFVEEISGPAVLQMIAMSAMNLRKDLLVYPSMLLTGRTGTGKSSLAFILKHMCGYHRDSRKYNLGGVSKQPLSGWSSDDSILHFEELTEYISTQVEQMLRNIVNRDKGARGMVNGNLYYNYKSPLLITGERSFTDESLNNRFLSLYIAKKHRANKDKDESKLAINNLMRHTASFDIYETLIKHQKELPILYKKHSERLSNIIESRTADVRAFAFAMNELFGYLVNENKLSGYMETHTDISGFSEITDKNPEALLQTILLKGCLTRELHYYYLDSTNTYVFVMLKPGFWETNRNKLGFIMSEINNRGDKTWITADTDSINIKIYPDDMGVIDKALYMMIESVLSNLPYKIKHAV